MASIPLDFDKMAALTPPRATKTSSNGPSADSTPFLDHIQAPAPAKKAIKPPDVTHTSRSTDVNRAPVSKPGPASSPTEDKPISDEVPTDEVTSDGVTVSTDEDTEEKDNKAATQDMVTAIVVAPLPTAEKKVKTEEHAEQDFLREAESPEEATQQKKKVSKVPTDAAQGEPAVAALTIPTETPDAAVQPVAEPGLTTQEDEKSPADVVTANVDAISPKDSAIVGRCLVVQSGPEATIPDVSEAEATESVELEATAVPVATTVAKKEEKAESKKGTDAKAEKTLRSATMTGKHEETTSPKANKIATTEVEGEREEGAATASAETKPVTAAKSRGTKDDPSEVTDKLVSNEGATLRDAAPTPAATVPTADGAPKDSTAPTSAPPAATVMSATQPVNAEHAVSASLRLPSHLLGTSGARSPSASPATEVEPTRFLQRVAKAFQAAQDRDGEIRLRLSPPELGALRLEVKVQDGVMTARMEAESPTAKALLIEHLPALRERLAEQGIRVDQFDIDLMNRQSGGNGAENMPRGDERQAQPSANQRFGNERRNQPAAEASAPLRAARTTDGRLNVIV